MSSRKSINESGIQFRTIHLPLVREGNVRPEATICVRRNTYGTGEGFQVGVAVCSLGDQFQKRTGRLIAFHRMNGAPLIGDPETLRNGVALGFQNLDKNRPGTISVQSILDLSTVFGELEERFQKMEASGSQSGVMASCCGVTLKE